ncbi:MAG: cell division protein ZipA [Gammaproteobacteria bacterium]|nr:MAG: cell division protein ZipA [Gammaproteobacteria bacterium]
MGELRWVLIVSGILLLAGIYLYSRRSDSAGSMPEERREPGLDSLDSEPEPEAEGATAPPSADVTEHPAARLPDKVVALRLMARSGAGFAGEPLVLALRNAGLQHGRFGIFHRYPDGDGEEALFSVASLVEPGSFDLGDLRNSHYPGVSIFMALPMKSDALRAFDDMLATARRLADELDGDLLDEQGSTLSIQRQRFMREEVLQYLHRADGPVERRSG